MSSSKEIYTIKVKGPYFPFPGDATQRAVEAFGPFPGPARCPPYTVVGNSAIGVEGHVIVLILVGGTRFSVKGECAEEMLATAFGPGVKDEYE
jgi:hypothetical protein